MMFLRWLQTPIVLQLTMITASVDWCNLRCDKGLVHTMCGFEEGSSGRECKGVQNTMTPSKRADLLHWHNSYRNNFAEGKLQVPGNFITGVANMRQMTYYEDLETIAQKWAEQCIPAHDVCRTTPKFQDELGFNSGQNFGTQEGGMGIPSDELTRYNFLEWTNERKNVPGAELSSFGRMDDAQKETWSHWTQLVWANSYTLGCGEVVYEVEGHFERTTFCNYGPGGNLKKQRVFRVGKPCSRCPRGTSCRFDSEYPSLCALPSDPKFRQDFILRSGHYPTSDQESKGSGGAPLVYQDELERTNSGVESNQEAETDDHIYQNKPLWHEEPGQHEPLLNRGESGDNEPVKHVEPGDHERGPVKPVIHQKMNEKHLEPGRHEIKDPKAGRRKHVEPGRHEMLLRKHKEPGRHEPEPEEHMEPGKHEPELPMEVKVTMNQKVNGTGEVKQELEQHDEPGLHEPELEEHDEPGEHESVRLMRKKKKRPRILYGGRAGLLEDAAATTAEAAAPAATAAAKAVAPAAAAIVKAGAAAAINAASPVAAAAPKAAAIASAVVAASTLAAPGDRTSAGKNGCERKWLATDRRLSILLSLLVTCLLCKT